MDELCEASRMEISFIKSTMYKNAIPTDVLVQMDAISPFSRQGLDENFKYLGFNLKPNGYGKKYLKWLLAKVEKRLRC